MKNVAQCVLGSWPSHQCLKWNKSVSIRVTYDMGNGSGLGSLFSPIDKNSHCLLPHLIFKDFQLTESSSSFLSRFFDRPVGRTLGSSSNCSDNGFVPPDGGGLTFTLLFLVLPMFLSHENREIRRTHGRPRSKERFSSSKQSRPHVFWAPTPTPDEQQSCRVVFISI